MTKEEIARAFKRAFHSKCCLGAALDDVCRTLTEPDIAGAEAVLALLHTRTPNIRGGVEPSAAQVEAGARVAYLRNRDGTDSWDDLHEQHKQDWRDKVRPVIISALSTSPAPAAEVAGERAEKDEAYRQRNHLVAALAHLFPSGIRATNVEGWDPEWHGCVYIDLPAGQISYHYHNSQAHLFFELPDYTKPWDGHDKETVHARLATLASPNAAWPSVGEGWQLVPKKATKEMLDAAIRQDSRPEWKSVDDLLVRRLSDQWDIMLAAAPPSAGDGA